MKNWKRSIALCLSAVMMVGLLASCGSDTVRNVAASVGIDVNSVDYWRSALDVVRGEINEFLALSEKKC